MVRSTRVNCKKCKSFDDNEYCESCYKKSLFAKSNTAIVLLAEKLKLEKEIKKYKMIGGTIGDFFFLMFGFVFGSILGALGFGQFILGIVNCIKFNSLMVSFNFALFDLNIVGIGLICFVMGFYLLHRTIDEIYIKIEEDD